ncbi:hypothetical protein AX15_000513 [Amanita polypyramis BW_CC]|nr:hypothetical protein AX15_000513 [Amanita polypyramis BW_CC]
MRTSMDSTLEDLNSGDFVVRRKRRRHPAYCGNHCCLLCYDDSPVYPEELALPQLQQSPPLSGQLDIAYSTDSDTLFQRPPSRTAYADQNDACTSNDRDSQQTSPESQAEPDVVPPGTGAINLVTVDNFLKHYMCATTKKSKTYKARFVKLIGQQDDPVIAHGTEYLRLRSRQIERLVSSRRPSTSPGSDSVPPTRTSRRQGSPKRRKQKRNRLATKLLNAVIVTSGEPNEDLLQSVADDENLRIALQMVPQPPSSPKPRKWCLVDPRKVTAPFRASTFKTVGEKKMTVETPMSYGLLTSQQFALAREFARGDPETWVGSQEMSSPCVGTSRRILAKKVVVKSPPPLDLVSLSPRKGGNVHKSSRRIPMRSKVKTRASATNVPSEYGRFPEGLYLDNGRRPLDMVPVPIKSRIGHQREDSDAGQEPNSTINPCTSISNLCIQETSNSIDDVRLEPASSPLSQRSVPASVVSEFSSAHSEHPSIASSSRSLCVQLHDQC